LINGIFLFLLKDSSIFENGYASMDQFFDLAPWVLLFLIPAISMRSLSDELKSGTFELLKTKPLKPLQIVVGKYLSVLLISLFAIIPTFVYVITISYFSSSASIDSGGIAGSYIGLFLLSATFASICLCCSGITSNSVVAFLMGGFICLVFYFGFNSISKISIFQGTVDYYIEMLGIDFHYKSISRGVLDTRDLMYFFSVIFLSLFITKKKLYNE
jgi:ABC-2 type transport system permease protein